MARLRVIVDDSYRLRVNGIPAPQPIESGRAGQVYDLTKLLRPGKNVLAFEVYNAVGVGGLLATGSIRVRGGAVYRIRSDPSFRASRTAPKGWDQPGFDDSSWPNARVVGSAFSAPWFQHPAFDVTPAELIAGIITEHGILRPPYPQNIADQLSRSNRA